MKTNYKFTVILSAYDGAQSELNNLINSDALAARLAILYDVTRAVGVFQGQCEQSFVIHTNSSNDVESIKRIAWEYNQQSTLVSNNRVKRIQLHYPDTGPLTIGDRFVTTLTGALCDVTIVDGQAWTVR